MTDEELDEMSASAGRWARKYGEWLVECANAGARSRNVPDPATISVEVLHHAAAVGDDNASHILALVVEVRRLKAVELEMFRVPKAGAGFAEAADYPRRVEGEPCAG